MKSAYVNGTICYGFKLYLACINLSTYLVAIYLSFLDNIKRHVFIAGYGLYKHVNVVHCNYHAAHIIYLLIFVEACIPSR